MIIYANNICQLIDYILFFLIQLVYLIYMPNLYLDFTYICLKIKYQVRGGTVNENFH